MLSDIIKTIMDKKKQLALKTSQDTIKSKPVKRQEFYRSLYDYINSSGERIPDTFFGWYITQLNNRKEKYPDWGKWLLKTTKIENETSLRFFLGFCNNQHISGVKFTKILAGWLPPEEYRILSANKSSDISKTLLILIDICQDKIDTSTQISEAIQSNVGIFLIAFVIHFVISSFLYPSFINRALLEGDYSFFNLPMLERNFVIYEFIQNNYVMIIIFLISVYAFFAWSIKNWSNKLIYIREQFIDYLPPYSLAKINQQYQLVMIVSNFMKSGESFNKALKQAHNGAEPYIKYQIEKILKNSASNAHEAFNIFYLGETGNLIEEKGGSMQIGRALDELLPPLRIKKKKVFKRVIGVTTTIMMKPLIYGSMIYFMYPVITNLMSVISNIQTQQ